MKQPPDASISIERTITRVGPQGRREVMDILLREERYELVCNGTCVAELHCMPSLLRELAVGGSAPWGFCMKSPRCGRFPLMSKTAS